MVVATGVKGIKGDKGCFHRNLSICQPICQPYNPLFVSALCPLADRLTDISRFKKLRYIFLVRHWSFKRFRIPRVEGTGFKGFGAPCTLFFKEKKGEGESFCNVFPK